VSGDVLPSILGIILVAAAAAFVLLPFARGAHVERTAALSNAAADRFGLYRQVLELEFDRDMGKLSQADFEQLSAELLAQAGAALRDERGVLGAVDEEIEREIAAARAAFAAARQQHHGRASAAETSVP
jgi:cytochrome c-type biogenesis protein CcmI